MFHMSLCQLLMHLALPYDVGRCFFAWVKVAQAASLLPGKTSSGWKLSSAVRSALVASSALTVAFCAVGCEGC